MKQYLDMVKHVLENGEWKSPVRKNNEGEWEPVDGGVRTLACPNVFFSHDMSDGFPLLTTKKMAFKTMSVELEGFIKGITNKSWYQEHNCKIWNEWANPIAVKHHYLMSEFKNNDTFNQKHYDNRKKQAQLEETDLGPIYGYQWTSFNQHFIPTREATDYNNQKQILAHNSEVNDNVTGLNGDPKGANQLKNIVEALRTNPSDRRMVCSAWNPNQMHMMALPPCHYAWNVTVIGNKLNLFWAQRSADLMLGVPFNIASYALLLSLLAKDAGLERGNLSACFVDCHAYENQLEGAREQIKRTPDKLPKLDIKTKLGSKFNIFEWEYKDTLLTNYNPQEKITFGDVVV